MFVGKCYICDELFKLSIMAIRPKINKIDNSFAYILESSNLWYGRLEHINYDILRSFNLQAKNTYILD